MLLMTLTMCSSFHKARIVDFTHGENQKIDKN